VITAGRAVSLVLVVAMALSACGGHKPANPSVSEKNERVRPAPAPARPRGLAVLICPYGVAPVLEFVDPNTGKPVRTITTAAVAQAPGEGLDTDLNCPLIGGFASGVAALHAREQFSPDFARQAATTPEQRDGSTHVGYVELSSGRFVDITAASSSTKGFSQTAASDDLPLFSSDGRTLLFRRNERTVEAFNLDTRHLAQVGRLPFETGYDSNFSFVAAAGARPVDALPTDDGSQAVDVDSTDLSPSAVPRLRLLPSNRFPDSFLDQLTQADKLGGTLVTLRGVGSCTPQAWADNQTLICAGSRGFTTRDQLEVLHLPRGGGQTTPRRLLPPNDRDNHDPVLAPDAPRVAFLSSRGELVTLYSVAATGGQPTRIADIPHETGDGSPQLLAWIP
jgi:hypothetical protein